MKVISKDLTHVNGDVRIVTLADIHIGSPKCQLQRLRSEIDRISKDKNTFVILAGDLINNGTKNTFAYQDEFQPFEQLKLVMEVLKPISDKILCITNGNHEDRTFRESGQDLSWIIAKQFGIEECYDQAGCVLILKVGNGMKQHNGGNKDGTATYSIYVSHGSGGGRTIGAKANQLQRRGDIVNADVVIQCHTHTPLTFKEDSFIIDTNNKMVRRKETTFVNVAGWLDYEEYAEKNGLRPSNLTNPTILLGGDTKRYISVFF